MPKLDSDAAKRVEDAESSGGLMEEGLYEMVLTEVTATGKDGKPLSGPAGPYWKWEFTVPEDAPRYPKWKQWVNTSLSEQAAWKLKEVFEAFGRTPDTDTDELIGQRVRVEVGTRTIQQGERTGEVANQVRSVLPLDPSASATPAGSKDKGKSKADKALY